MKIELCGTIVMVHAGRQIMMRNAPDDALQLMDEVADVAEEARREERLAFLKMIDAEIGAATKRGEKTSAQRLTRVRLALERRMR